MASTQNSSLPKITEGDLKANDPTRLNRVLDSLTQQVVAAQGLASKVQPIPTRLVVEEVTITAQDSTSTPADNDAITFATAKRYFSPQAQKAAATVHQFLGAQVTTTGGAPAATANIVSTYATWRSTQPAANYPVGTSIFLQDYGLTYIVAMVSNTPTWVYQTGRHALTQPAIAAFVSTLGAADTGLLIEVTDFRHLLEWNGSAFFWAPEDDGSNRFTFGGAPVTLGWVAVAGQAISYLNGDGTTTAITLPSFATPRYLVMAAATGAQSPAVAPIITVTPTNDVGSGTVVQTGVGTTVAAHTHQHADTAAADLLGEPPHQAMKAWFRI